MRPTALPPTRASASRARFGCKNAGEKRVSVFVGSCFNQVEGVCVAFVLLGMEEASLLHLERGNISKLFSSLILSFSLFFVVAF